MCLGIPAALVGPCDAISYEGFRAGFRVLTHRRVPPNDGGLSFGQASVACARDAIGACGATGEA